MKEELLGVVSTTEDPLLAGNLAREYLQARILLALQDAGAMIPLAFHGGTALRFLFALPRFSEDLDFALERPERSEFAAAPVSERVGAQLVREGYGAVTTVRADRVVQRIQLAFPGLLHDAGLSPHAAQTLRIRIEVDTHPPLGAGLTTTVLRRHAVLNLQHHDRPSLLSGKLHAILERRWTKGRDLFDLFWYLSDPTWPEPNLLLLNNALAQTGWTGPTLDEATWRTTLHDRIQRLDWESAARDVAPFLQPGPAAELFGKENLLRVLVREG